MLISSNSTDIPSSKSPWRIWILFKHKNATSHEWRYIALKLFWIQFLWLWEYKSFVQCVLFLLQYYILFSHSSANDDIISLFLYYMEFVKLQQDSLSLKRFVCLIRHQICYMQSVLQHASFMVPVILQSNHWLRWCHRLQNTDQ